MVLDGGVRDLGCRCQEGGLGALILFENSLLLSVSEHEQLLFFGCREVSVSSSPLLDLVLEDGEQWVVLILHDTLSKASKSRLEELVLDSGFLSWIR